MATVKPFKGMRYTENAGKINELVCPPYDIISDEQRKEYLKTNQNNVIRLELPREGDDVYAAAESTLKKWLENGVVAEESENSFYVYEEEFEIEGETKSFKGVIARVKITDFDEGVIIPHENTLSAAKEDRYNLMCATDCNFSQIYCIFQDDGNKVSDELNKISENDAVYNFKDAENVTHRLWKTTNTATLTDLFKDKMLYIADGHHRYETALRYRNAHRKTAVIDENADSEYVMMMLVPMESDGLVVFPTHRIIHSLENFDGKELVSQCREYFHAGEMTSKEVLVRNLKDEYNAGKISFGLYFSGRYFLLTLKNSTSLEQLLPDITPALRDLDVTVLHSLILERILGIDKENMAKQINLKYTRDYGDAINEVESGANCAFLLNPTRVSQIAAVGNAGAKMPQKSTYFYPKLITGLVMNKMNNK